MVDKNTLRQVYLEKRLFLSAAELERRNQLLSEQVAKQLIVDEGCHIHTFMSMTSKKEVDTRSIMNLLLHRSPSIQFVTSKTKPGGVLEHYLVNNTTEYMSNKWGIPEPVNAALAEISKIDIVLVPLITFDKHGHRIGYGKGYYDRFFKLVPNALKVGLALGPPLDKIDYVDKYDVPLDACCTPFHYYRF